ncbi:MAG: Delta-60 repeat-containing protein [Phycisphaerales bacterium]|nr:Delta-60 repeat-containing protein [Phycisphaerales bacterium]
MSRNKRFVGGFSTRPCAPRAVIEGVEQRLFMSAGQFDPTFGTRGAAYGELFPGAQADATALQSDGKIIVAGSGLYAGPALDLARFNPDGTLDRRFGVNGRVTTDLGAAEGTINAVGVQRDGKIVVAGFRYTPGTIGISFLVARYLTTGALDTGFGTKGIATISFLGNDMASSLVIERNGEIDVAGGAQTNSQAPAKFALARLTAAGQLDSTFGKGGEVLTSFAATGGSINSLLIQPNGDLIATGATDSGNNYYYTTLVRYLPGGSLDPSFGSGGIVNSSTIPAFASGGIPVGAQTHPTFAALQSNGKIDIATTGSSLVQDYSQSNTLYVERFNANGSTDTTFGSAGLASYSRDDILPNTVMIQKNGDIVVAGTNVIETPVNSISQFLFVRFSTAGVLGTVTATPMAGTNIGGGATAGAAVQQPDQRIIVVGSAPFGGSDFDFALARYTLAGILDNTFGYHGTVQQPDGITGLINSIAVQSDGKILIAGSEQSPDPATQPTDAVIARYNANGTLDTTFGADGRRFLRIGNNAAWNSIKVQSNGDILVGGYGQVGGVDVFALARYLPSGLGDPTFGTGGEVLAPHLGPFSTGEVCNSLAIQSNGRIVAAGYETDAGSTGRGSTGTSFAVARFLTNGSLDPSFDGSGGALISVFNGFQRINAAAISVLVLKNDEVLVGGTAGNNFDILDVTGGTFHLKSPFGTSFADGAATLTAMAIDPTSGDIVAGGYVTSPVDANKMEFALARYTPTGQLDSTFGIGGELTVNATGGDRIESLAIQADGKIVTGGIGSGTVSTGGSSVHPLLQGPPSIFATVARFTSKGLDTTFGQGGLTLLNGGVTESFFNSSCNIALDANGKILAGDIDLYRLNTK